MCENLNIVWLLIFSCSENADKEKKETPQANQTAATQPTPNVEIKVENDVEKVIIITWFCILQSIFLLYVYFIYL